MNLGNWFTGYVTGILAATAIALGITWQDPTARQIGITHKEVKQMKEQCEKELPRNKQCVPVFTFKVED